MRIKTILIVAIVATILWAIFPEWPIWAIAGTVASRLGSAASNIMTAIAA